MVLALCGANHQTKRNKGFLAKLLWNILYKSGDHALPPFVPDSFLQALTRPFLHSTANNSSEHFRVLKFFGCNILVFLGFFEVVLDPYELLNGRNVKYSPKNLVFKFLDDESSSLSLVFLFRCRRRRVDDSPVVI